VLRSSLFLLLEMLLPSLLVLSGLGWIDLLLRTFSPSHPAHVETCALPNDEHALYKWYFQASLSHSRSSLDQSKRARVLMIPPSSLVLSQRVARLVSNVRASTRTAHSVTIRAVWCGRWASTRDQRANYSFLPRAQGLTRLILCVASGEHRRSISPHVPLTSLLCSTLCHRDCSVSHTDTDCRRHTDC
jgi:hypothetical protein